MKILTDYFKLRDDIFAYFGYVEDWVCIPLDDVREMYWKLRDDVVLYAEEQNDVVEETGNHYEDEIYTQRFLPYWVYRGKDYTMISCNPGVDGNKFLRIFDNSKELTTEADKVEVERNYGKSRVG